jgi:hypothetical protein
MKACQEATVACLGETEARIETGQEPREGMMNVTLEVTEACLEKSEADERKVKTRWKHV